MENIKNPLLPGSISNMQGAAFLSSLISTGIGFIVVIAAVIFIFMMIWGGIQWILSGGDKGSVQSAQGKITHAIIGLVVLLSTYAVVSILGWFFNIPSLQSPFMLDISELKIGP